MGRIAGAHVIEIRAIANANELAEDVLRARANQPKGPFSLQFVACIIASEAGYMCFDDRQDIKTGVIYDLLVLPSFRRRGVGTRLLNFAEQLAASLGCTRLRLIHRAFDGSVERSWLESWYFKKGYRLASDNPQ